MNILIVAPEQIPVPPVLGGSVEVCVLSIVTVISRTHPAYKKIQVEKNLTILRVPSHGEKAYTRAVIHAIQGKHFDWIQVDNRPYLASAIKNAYPYFPVSLFLHSTTFVTPPFRTVRDASSMMSNLDLIMTNSVSTKEYCARLFPAHRAKLRTVLLGVDSIRFRPCHARERLQIRHKYAVNRSFNVLFVGRLIPKKGVPTLIKAMHLARQQRKGMRLIVVGGTQHKSYLNKLKNMAKAYRVPTTFIGKLPHRLVHRTYWLGDCFVCPSQKHEPFGLVNVEAMASGLPVIASSNGGIQEIVRDGHNGFLIQSYHQAHAFTRKIIELASQPAKRNDYAKQARRDAIRKFGWHRTAQHVLSIYRDKLAELHRGDA
jgi:spore coat protein SA